MAPLTASGYVQNALVRRATVAESLTPSDEQKTTLYVLGAYVVFITVAWNLWGLRHILYPWKRTFCDRTGREARLTVTYSMDSRNCKSTISTLIVYQLTVSAFRLARILPCCCWVLYRRKDPIDRGRPQRRRLDAYERRRSVLQSSNGLSRQLVDRRSTCLRRFLDSCVEGGQHCGGSDHAYHALVGKEKLGGPADSALCSGQ